MQEMVRGSPEPAPSAESGPSLATAGEAEAEQLSRSKWLAFHPASCAEDTALVRSTSLSHRDLLSGHCSPLCACHTFPNLWPPQTVTKVLDTRTHQTQALSPGSSSVPRSEDASSCPVWPERGPALLSCGVTEIITCAVTKVRTTRKCQLQPRDSSTALPSSP